MTFDIEEIQKALREGMTIAEACTKYNITFKDLCANMHGYSTYTSRTKRPTGYKWIHQTKKGKYRVMRHINGNAKAFGEYDTLEDAVKMRDYLCCNGWYKNRVKKIREELNI